LRLVVASSLIGASALQLPAIRAPASCNRATCVRMEDVDLPFDEGEQLEEAEAAAAAAAEAEQFTAAIATAPGRSTWGITQVSPDGSLVQRIEGKTRKTWKFSDFSKDRVQVALTSEGRPVNADVQLWLGPDWTPFTLKAYSEDGKLRPVQTLVGTRNKAAMIEVRNVGEYEFPFSAASNYAQGPMVALASDIPASTPGELVQGGALASFPLEPSAEQLEVVLRTDGKQLHARIELLTGPNNPKQTYEVFTNNGILNSLCVAFNTPGPMSTVRIVNLAPVEFPCYIHLKES